MHFNIKEIQNLPFSDIRNTYEYYTIATKSHLEVNPYDSYRVDRSEVLQYFSIFPKWQDKVLTFCSHLKTEGKPFTYLDVCGRASGRKLGAEKSYLFSLKTDRIKRLFYDPSDIFVDGNIFNPNDFPRLISEIRNKGAQLAFVTFMPMAGLHHYAPIRSHKIELYEKITYAILARRLASVISVLHPGGFIMIERPFQFDGTIVDAIMRLPQNQYKISVAMKALARKFKCKIEIASEIGGPYFLIQKPVR